MAWHSRRFRRDRVVNYFILLMLITGCWALLYGLEMSVDSLDLKVALLKARFLVQPFTTIAILALALTYIDRGAWLTRRNLAILCIIPAATAVLGLTSGSLPLFKYDFSLLDHGFFLVLNATNGPAYYVYTIYGESLVLISMVLLAAFAWRHKGLYRRQSLLLLMAFLIPAGTDFLFQTGLLPTEGFNPTSSLFSIGGILLLIALFRYRLLQLYPVARNLVENLPDPVLVFDRGGSLVDANAASRELFRLRAEDLGQLPADALGGHPELFRRLAQGGDFREEVRISVNGQHRIYDGLARTISVDQEKSRVVLLRDITERKALEKALLSANNRLGLLSTITRHDLQNKLTAMDGYVSLARMEQDPARVREHLDRYERSSAMVRSILNFTREYERLGLTEPGWYDVRAVWDKAVKGQDLGAIVPICSLAGLEIFADALFEKVFPNLIDNTIRHGEKATVIELRGEETPDGFRLIYQDDGKGISPGDHDKIFQRGYGRNTGLGLFLVREVLAITGITIEENGEEGRGVRFEMIIPHGTYRMASDYKSSPLVMPMGAEP